PLQELSKHDLVSQEKGRMHACGHDGHGTVLLSVAKYLAKTRNFKGKAVLIFQPGEEGWAGAKHMIEDGLFERFPVDEVYAFHNAPAIPFGKVALNNGAMQAAADIIDITVKGKGGHGARPHNAQDPIVASAHIITALQSIVSRNVDPLETAVVSICHIHAGDEKAQSVIPESCHLIGTARTFDPKVRDLVESRIKEVAENIAEGMGCEAEVNYVRFYPPCINTKELAKAVGDIAAKVVGEENVDRDYPRMPGGEDFAFMLEEVPGAYFRVGQNSANTHNPYFDFDDEIIPLAGTIMSRIVETRLKALDKKAND
ncbi:MAG: amidohydrolase, partial [Burkholderiales bacterium]|nr:amidohydrolase [Burkholderiales bacterium]